MSLGLIMAWVIALQGEWFAKVKSACLVFKKKKLAQNNQCEALNKVTQELGESFPKGQKARKPHHH